MRNEDGVKVVAVSDDGKRVLIHFPFDLSIVEKVRDIPGREWDKVNKIWSVPNSPFHYDKIVEILDPLGFDIEPAIRKGADRKAPPPKHKYPEGLYPFQRIGVDYLYAVNGRAILADDMGLGKTITSLAYVRMFGGKLLVVCPANVVYKWDEEVAKWIPDATRQVVDSGKTAVADNDVTIMSYAMMVSHFDALNEIPFQVVIFDEAHYLKGRKTQRGRAGKALVKNGIPKVLMLSGTPFENRPDELFPLANAVDPAGFANFFQFAKRYMGAEYIDGMWYFPPGLVTNQDELHERLRHIMIRRTKKQVEIDLPELTRSYVPVELTNKAAYKAAIRDITTWLKGKDRSVLNPTHVLTRLNVLRQVVGEGKAKAAIELAEDVLQGGKKVVLFAHHKEVIITLAAGLAAYGVKLITGETPQKERQANVHLFQDPDSKIRVMICSTAGSEGIDLFAASDVIMVERQWTPAKEEQMEARLHRMGQKNSVTAWYIVAKGTVDEKLNKVVRLKRETIGKVIDQDEIIEAVLEDL
jgi:SNF2 family DNA or RNA helicase